MQDKIPLLILLSVGAVFTSVWLILLRKRLNIAWYAAIMIAMLCITSGVIFVKVFAFVETGLSQNSLGNMSLFGAVFGMPLIFFFLSKFNLYNGTSPVINAYILYLQFVLLHKNHRGYFNYTVKIILKQYFFVTKNILCS